MRLFYFVQTLSLSVGLSVITACTSAPEIAGSVTSPAANPDAKAAVSAVPITPASATPAPPTQPKETEVPKTPETQELTVTGIKIIQIPTALTLGDPAVILKAQVELSDGSFSNGVLFSVDNKEVLNLEGGTHLTPLTVGSAKITVSSLKDLNIKETIDIQVQAGDAINEPTLTPEEEVITEPSLNSYYRDDYRVGMRWEYALGLESIKIDTGNQPVPPIIPLAYGLKIEGATEDNLLALIYRLLDQQKEMGLWSLEVSAVDPEKGTVTLRSQLDSYSEYVTAQPPIETTYTPETIGTAFADLMQLSHPDQRAVKYIKSNVLLKDTQEMPGEPLTTDYFESTNTLTSGPLDQEDISFWFNQELGLVQKNVTIKKLVQGYLQTETAVHINLQSFSG